MNRRSSSFRSLAVAATADSITSAAAMSYRPYFRGGRPHSRRGYSDKPLGPASGDQGEIVSGDSHFLAVRDANRSFRPRYTDVPPPHQDITGQQFYGPGSQSPRPGPPVFQQFPGPRPHRHARQVRPVSGNHQQLRPQQMQQQFKLRASKPPDYRHWEYAKPEPPPHCEWFTVLSYNILADYLAIDHWQKLYFHIPRYIMDWNWRKRNISFELGLWSADILCFQEVDRFQDIETELKPRGYSGIWKMRTGDPADGCAIFWRVSRFKLLHEESIEYNKLGLRDNVAQICVFESLNGQHNSNGASTPSTSCCSVSSNRVIVCNIHVLFNPKRGDVKLGQIRVLLDRAHAVSKLWDDAPIVICGDFNCTPKSPIYNFITGQKLDLSELARDKVSGQATAEIRPSRPAYPDFRTRAANDSPQASAVNNEKTEQGDLPLDAQKLTFLPSSKSAPSTVSYSGPGCSVVDETSVSCTGEECRNRRINDLPSHETADGHAGFVLSLSEVDDGTADALSEDCESFLSELHSISQSHLPADLESSSTNQKLHSHDNEILNDTIYVEREIIVNAGSSSSHSSPWTPAEIETATGSADCNVMEHPLNLTSAYAEVENSSGLRDSSGEPLVTSYHRRFSGTVDYIWHSEGLQTARVLAPIPKHVMQQTRGFPTKKWGSDHIALVSEFAFTKGISSENVSQ